MNKLYATGFIILLSAMYSLPAIAEEVPGTFDPGIEEVSETVPSVDQGTELHDEDDPVVDSSEGVFDESTAEESDVANAEEVDGSQNPVSGDDQPVVDDTPETTETVEEEVDSSQDPVVSDDEIAEIVETTETIETIEESPTFNVPNIIISEINWAGSALSTADEWIELYNASSVDVDLSGWVLTGSATKGNALALAEGTILKAHSTLLISNYAFGHEKTTLNIEPDLVTSALSLPNSKLSVMLTTPEGVVVDAVTFSGKASAGSSDPVVSMERNLNSSEWEDATASTNLLDKTQLGTPGTVGYTNVVTGPKVLFINEVVSNPIDGVEWIEIYNPGDESIDLEGWTVRDATEKATALLGFVEPNGLFVIENPKGQLNNGGDLVELINPENQIVDVLEYGTNIPAPDKGESLILEAGEWFITASPTKGEVNVMTEEEAENEGEQPSSQTESEGEQPSSQVVIEEEVDSSQDTVVSGENPQPTTDNPTSDYSPELTAYEPGALLITEFVSDPEDGVEWIEISNPGDSSINLAGWSVTDATDKPTALEGTIEPGGQFVIENPKGQLNNGGDTITLFDPSGSVIDGLEYGGDIPAPEKGESTALKDGTWSITTNPTKGETNQTTYETKEGDTSSEATSTIKLEDDHRNESENVQDSYQERAGADLNLSDQPATHLVVAIAESTKVKEKSKIQKSKSKSSTKSKTKAISKRVTRSGVITAVPGTFGSQIAFMDNLQLYFYYSDWPKLEIGDMVTITGEMSEARGEERIKIASADDIKITGHQEMQPKELELSEVLNATPGSLVKTTGQVVEKNGDKLIIESNGVELTIVANSREGMKWSSLETGLITVTGVVRHINGEVRLYPRSMDDIEQHFAPEVEEEENDDVIAAVSRSKNITPWLGFGMLAAVFSALGYWFLKAKQTNLELKTN